MDYVETTKLGVTVLIRPVQDTLKRYAESVTKVEAERRDALGVLQAQIEAMRTGTERFPAEAANLVNALRTAAKARGFDKSSNAMIDAIARQTDALLETKSSER